MNLDIRLPIGLLFSLLGVVLAAYGLLADPAGNARSLGYNVNLGWGVAILVFGLVMLWLGRRGMPTSSPAASSPEGRATEAREHAAGLEHEGRPRAGAGH